MRQFAVRVSFVEFYLDNIFDLLSNDNKVKIVSILETLVEVKH